MQAPVQLLALPLSIFLASSSPPEPTAPQSEQNGKAEDQAKSTERDPFQIHRASSMRGMEVLGSNSEALGSLEELLIDPTDGSVDYAVIAHGGFLGLGEDLYVVPFEMIRAGHNADDEDCLRIQAQKSQLEAAPTMPKDSWPAIDRTWEENVRRAFGKSMEKEAPGRKLVRCTSLEGTEVQGLSDAVLGDIQEVIIDPDRDRVVYFALGTGGFLGLGEKVVALPWSMTEINLPKEGELAISFPTDEETLSRAPEFDPENWEQMANPTWVRTVYVFYSVRPYWGEAVEAAYEKQRSEGNKDN